LAGGHKKESKVPPEFDFSAHKYFPVVKLVWEKDWKGDQKGGVYFQILFLEDLSVSLTT
jgi:hypothetical protein